MSFISCPLPSVNYGMLPSADIKLLWEQVGNNLSPQRISALHSGMVTAGSAEMAYVLVRLEMIRRKIPCVPAVGW